MNKWNTACVIIQRLCWHHNLAVLADMLAYRCWLVGHKIDMPAYLLDYDANITAEL